MPRREHNISPDFRALWRRAATRIHATVSRPPATPDLTGPSSPLTKASGAGAGRQAWSFFGHGGSTAAPDAVRPLHPSSELASGLAVAPYPYVHLGGMAKPGASTPQEPNGSRRRAPPWGSAFTLRPLGRPLTDSCCVLPRSR